MLSSTSIDDLETALRQAATAVSRLRSIQLDVLRQLDEAGVANIDGARTMVEWVTAKLDVAPENARALVQASHDRQVGGCAATR